MKNLKTTFAIILFTFFASFCNAQQLPDKDTTKYGHNPAVGKYADIRGFKMYYEVYGKGQPLLIIHGNGGSINNFRYQIPYFAKNYQVILADSRAQGKSADDKDSLSYEMMTDDLNALLDNLKLKDVNVIGWSDGGIEGLLLAINHPDKVKKLAVTGANLWPDTSAVDEFVYNYAFKMNQVAADTMKKIKNPTAEMKNQVKLLHLLTYEPHIKLEALKKITCPTLVIGGDHDVLRTKHTMLIADNIANAYLWILPNSGHSTPIFYRDIFNQVVGDFLSKPYRKIEKFGRFE
ncbi:Pimeloyl-ACP methyl ester carboxylesterase [Mucilaginibacter pineti]|uniref:Pimeloyl-ACP methyl ester carboxylesterase n=1 Tax=Mucilaginibacter pineti TaxID=1391627 RepID=A0A1G7D5Y2_9SPHI|nr:alpha/beta hydrolase [Mucilaginibacter pineti]SDE46913.1 Pimeloyl-ACP methyl ester carboxylesterase [Mucilaginibacter pineti]